jgi:hypothetical protein
VINQSPDNAAYGIFATRDEVVELKKDLRREITQPWVIIFSIISLLTVSGLLGMFKWIAKTYVEWNKQQIEEVLNEDRYAKKSIVKPTIQESQ